MVMPTSPDALTAEWLSEVLRAAGTLKNGRVKSFDVRVLDGAKGALSQLAKISLEYDRDDDPEAPRRLFAKFAVADLEFRGQLHSSRLYEREIRFYQEFAPRIELRTPRCYFSEIDLGTGEFALLLEDLAPAQNGDRAAGCSPEQAELAIRNIARFHATWWESPQLTQTEWLQPTNIAARRMWSEMYGQRWGLFVEMLGSDLSSSVQNTGVHLRSELMNVFARRMDRSPQTLIHNDFQLDNFFFATSMGDASFTVVDWQLITPGSGPFDVGSFLGGNFSVEDRRLHEMRLLKMYHSTLMENGVEDYSFGRCFEDYRFAMLGGLFRMVISLGGMNMREEQVRSHRDDIWPRYQAAILDLNVAELLPA